MKRIIFAVMIMGIMFAFAAAPASAQNWEGKGEGWVDTKTVTYLNAGSSYTGCGSCNFGKNYFMEGAQAGSLSIGAKGSERNPDLVFVNMEGGYNTGYEQGRSIPGGYQSQWGEQWASGQVKLKSR